MERYSAFISYSHADERVARWLHRAIEGYRFPKALIGTMSEFGPVPKRLLPVFRDRDELPASADLGTELRAALAASRFQIVLCSPHSAVSKWVNEEILAFKRLHADRRTLALIIEGEPHSGSADECFPPALRFAMGPDGNLTDEPAEPIAADLRPGKDGRKLALLKILAGLSGLKLDSLARRDTARRQRRLATIAVGSVGIAVATIGLAIYAEAQRRVAVEQRELADRSLEFLIGTFSIANPATENPRTITALTILGRASRTAEHEFRGQPAISARLLRTTGDIYFNLGLYDESERDLKKVLAMEPAKSEGRGLALLKLARIERGRGNADKVRALTDQASSAYDSNADYAPLLDAMILEMRGQEKYLRADYEDAANAFRDARVKFGAAMGDNRRWIGSAFINEANSRVQIGQSEKANGLFKNAVVIFKDLYGEDSFFTATSVRNLAVSDYEMSKYDEALDNTNKSIEMYSKTVGENHPEMANSYLLLGRILLAKKKYNGSVAAFDKAIGIYAKVYGADNAAIGDVDFYAAEAEVRRGMPDAALTRLARTKRIYDIAYGQDDPDQAELLLQRARILSIANRKNEAANNCSAALALQRQLGLKAETLRSTANECSELGRN